MATSDPTLSLVPRGTVSLAEIVRAQTAAGGWTRKTLHKWGVPWPPPQGWKKRLARREATKP